MAAENQQIWIDQLATAAALVFPYYPESAF
jgi:hypothetical protein